MKTIANENKSRHGTWPVPIVQCTKGRLEVSGGMLVLLFVSYILITDVGSIV